MLNGFPFLVIHDSSSTPSRKELVEIVPVPIHCLRHTDVEGHLERTTVACCCSLTQIVGASLSPRNGFDKSPNYCPSRQPKEDKYWSCPYVASIFILPRNDVNSLCFSKTITR